MTDDMIDEILDKMSETISLVGSVVLLHCDEIEKIQQELAELKANKLDTTSLDVHSWLQAKRKKM